MKPDRRIPPLHAHVVQSCADFEKSLLLVNNSMRELYQFLELLPRCLSGQTSADINGLIRDLYLDSREDIGRPYDHGRQLYNFMLLYGENWVVL